jgi:hypothetical protein
MHEAMASAPVATPQNGGWANPFSEPAPVAASSAPSDEVSSYFDRLDQAFASFSGPAAPPAQPSASPALDWFGDGKSEPIPPDLPLSYGSPHAAFGAEAPIETPAPAAPPIQLAPPPPPAAAPIQSFVEPAAPRPVPPAAASGPTFPPLEQAFETLLAAEQSNGSPAFAAWASAPEAIAPPPIDSDAIVAEVSARVLEQLTDRVVRERVGEIVSQIAERLIRDEIEKIKERIK